MNILHKTEIIFISETWISFGPLPVGNLQKVSLHNLAAVWSCFVAAPPSDGNDDICIPTFVTVAAWNDQFARTTCNKWNKRLLRFGSRYDNGHLRDTALPDRSPTVRRGGSYCTTWYTTCKQYKHGTAWQTVYVYTYANLLYSFDSTIVWRACFMVDRPRVYSEYYSPIISASHTKSQSKILKDCPEIHNLLHHNYYKVPLQHFIIIRPFRQLQIHKASVKVKSTSVPFEGLN